MTAGRKLYTPECRWPMTDRACRLDPWIQLCAEEEAKAREALQEYEFGGVSHLVDFFEFRPLPPASTAIKAVIVTGSYRK
jgi:hypothetical protein